MLRAVKGLATEVAHYTIGSVYVLAQMLAFERSDHAQSHPEREPRRARRSGRSSGQLRASTARAPH